MHDEQKKLDIGVTQLKSGPQPRPTKRQHVEKDERLHRVVENFENTDLIAYLENVANNVVM